FRTRSAGYSFPQRNESRRLLISMGYVFIPHQVTNLNIHVKTAIRSGIGSQSKVLAHWAPPFLSLTARGSRAINRRGVYGDDATALALFNFVMNHSKMLPIFRLFHNGCRSSHNSPKSFTIFTEVPLQIIKR